jgi:hypothetical protein
MRVLISIMRNLRLIIVLAIAVSGQVVINLDEAPETRWVAAVMPFKP